MTIPILAVHFRTQKVTVQRRAADRRFGYSVVDDRCVGIA
jgi:hypothetical protein